MSPEDENNTPAPEEDVPGGNPPPPPPEEAPQPAGAAQPESAPTAAAGAEGQSAQFQTLTESVDPKAEKQSIQFLYDVELDVNIELGRAELKVRDVLSMQPGSVVELNKLVGDPVSIVVNDRLIARGEVIVLDENFAVRVTDILTASEIISTLS